MNTATPTGSSFAHRLQAARQRRDLTQARLAELADIDSTTVAHYENGSREPGTANMRSICRALDITADYLLGLSTETRRLA